MSDFIEEILWKAEALNIFKEVRERASKILKNQPKLPKDDAYVLALEEVKKEISEEKI